MGRKVLMRDGSRGIAMNAKDFFSLNKPHPAQYERVAEEPLEKDELVFTDRRKGEYEYPVERSKPRSPQPQNHFSSPQELKRELKRRGLSEQQIRDYFRRHEIEYAQEPDLVHAKRNQRPAPRLPKKR